MSNFLQLLPRLIVAAIAGIILFFLVTVGFLLAVIIAAVCFILALIFLRKNKVRFGNTQAYIFTSKTTSSSEASAGLFKKPYDGNPIIETTTILSPPPQGKASHSGNTSNDGPCIDLDSKDYTSKDREIP